MGIPMQDHPAKPEEYLPEPLVAVAITFGVQYGRDPERSEIHPLGMTGNGYAVIEAPDREIARAIAFAVFGRHWAFDYDLGEFLSDERREEWSPEGELLRIAWLTPSAMQSLQSTQDKIDRMLSDS